MKRFLAIVTAVLVARSAAHAGEFNFTQFNPGAMEVEFLSGAAASPVVGPKRRSYNYTNTELRLGWMLTEPRGDGWLGGNFEVLTGLGGGAILHGAGTGFGAWDVMLRYNFVHAHARFIPYLQAGAGVFYSDIAETQSQSEIGHNIEADLRGNSGFRYLLGNRWSLNGEIFFQHVSNAGTAPRNGGINALGAMIGFGRSL